MIAGKKLTTEVAGVLYDQGTMIDDEVVAQVLAAMAKLVAYAIDHHEVVEIPGVGLVGQSVVVDDEIEAFERAARASQAAREAKAKRRERKRKRAGRKVGGKSVTPVKRPGKTARKERVARKKNLKGGGIMPRNRKAALS